MDKSEPFLQNKKARRPYSTPNPGYRGPMTSINAVDPDALLHHTIKLQDWLNENSIKNIQVKCQSTLTHSHVNKGTVYSSHSNLSHKNSKLASNV